MPDWLRHRALIANDIPSRAGSLHNARAAEVQQGMEAQAASEAKAQQQALDAEYEKIAGIWKRIETAREEPSRHLTEQRDLALKRGFSQKIGHAVNGEACFRVSPAYWQARLVNRYLWDEATASASVFETGDALACVKDLIWPGLTQISKETSARMQLDFPAFQAPWHAVHSYLKWLKDRHWMFDKRVGLSMISWDYRCRPNICVRRSRRRTAGPKKSGNGLPNLSRLSGTGEFRL